MAKTVAVIPARYASTRFPGKPLVKIGGVSMIERVYKQVEQSTLINDLLVATDDERILAEVERFGGNAVMTSAEHATGTDRLAEVAASNAGFDIIVNVQGDEPLINPDTIDAAVAPLLADSSIEMGTIAAPLSSAHEFENPDIVKVVLDRQGFALYFSRSPIPHYRDGRAAQHRQHLGHIGLYVYRRNCLLKLAALKPTEHEKAECLEQLRALENGIRIKVVTGNYRSQAVDRPADVAAVERALAEVRFEA
jgi:3-deoxy-manno-octulosonate cytidylyltransferase (CMP-KDO synthetase)